MFTFFIYCSYCMPQYEQYLYSDTDILLSVFLQLIHFGLGENFFSFKIFCNFLYLSIDLIIPIGENIIHFPLKHV